jgi:riboflavin kinase/FMN adenylyltransferase
MTICRLSGFESAPPFARHGAVAVGNFDGVHRGHSHLMGVLTQRAAEVSGPAVAVTFDPHPLQLLAPERFQPLLTTATDRAASLRDAGADAVVILQTTPDLLRLSATDFFVRVLGGTLEARAIVEGFNFCFGRDRQGNNDLLADLCRAAGISFTIVEPFDLDGTPVSSSRVRRALLAGDVGDAARLLGRPYQVRGIVAEGAKRGRTLGFPTANLESVATLLPGDGVYAARASVEGRVYPAAVNIGPNPTFAETARKIEAHLIDFNGDLYGREISLAFLDRLRSLRKFESPADLMAQLRDDVSATRARVAAR